MRPRVGDVLGHRAQLVLGRQRPHACAVVERGAQPQRPGPPRELGEEALADAVVDVDALHRHAQLPRRREARRHRTGRGLRHVRVRQHDHRVLAAEFERVPGQPPGDGGRQPPARGCRPGEAHVVRLLDDGVADHRAPAEHDLPGVRGEPGLLGEFVEPQRRQRRLVVGLLHHGVARGECGQHVHRGQRQGVVPGGDDPDHAAGVPGVCGPGQHGKCSGGAPGREQACAVPAVVVGHERGRADLVEGVEACLAGLDLHQVEPFPLPGEDELVQPQQDPLPLRDARGGPRRLCFARTGEGGAGEPVGRLGQDGGAQPGERCGHRHRFQARAGHGPLDEELRSRRGGSSDDTSDRARSVVLSHCRKRAGHDTSANRIVTGE